MTSGKRRISDRRSLTACAIVIALVAAVNPVALGQTAATRPATQPATAPIAPAHEPAESMDSYYLRTCAVCSALLGARGDAVALLNEGRPLRVCGEACRGSFERDPAARLADLDAVMIADQLPHYPLKTSLFDERPLGAKPLDFIWGNRLFRAVDAADRERILADPAAAIRRLDRAVIAAQTPLYGMPDKCPVQGDILPTDRKVDVVVANRMVRVCCGRCAQMVHARPYQYLAMVEYANREAARRRKLDEDGEP